MTPGKILVQQALEFRHPERVPYNFDSNRTPVIEEKYGDDFEWVFVSPLPEFDGSIKGRPDQSRNELGVIYTTIPGSGSFGEPTGHPLADLAALNTYRLPDYRDPRRYLNLERAAANNPDKYILGMPPHFLFQHMIDLFGFENFMANLLLEPAAVEQVADMLTDSVLGVIDEFAKRGVNGIIGVDDQGLQDRLIVSPTVWRRIFKPRFDQIFQACHDRHMHVILHCCGQIYDIIPDFLEIKLDCLQLDQQDNIGIERLAGFAGKMCFFCPVDIQTTLPNGTFAQIEAKARNLIKTFGSNGGGFMAKTYPQPEAIRIPEANTKFMCECFKRYGRYPLDF
jgi:uroporphyrinogen decarboxylase